MEITLDKSKPHGIVFPPLNDPHGKSDQVAHFAQDGFHFTYDGDLVTWMLTDSLKKRAEILSTRKRADAAAEEARRKTLTDAGISVDEFGEEAAPKASSGRPEGSPQTRRTPMQEALDGANGKSPDFIDLVEWAKGKAHQEVLWFSIAKAAREQYAFSPASKEQLIQFLVRENLLTATEAPSR